MALMYGLTVVLVVGLGLAAWWSGVRYSPWRPAGSAGPGEGEQGAQPSLRDAATIALRAAAVALVGGFWTGILVTGPAMRLIMRLLAVTAGDEAQGRVTEAREIVGNVDLGGTFGLIVFGGILPSLVSAFAYLLIRRWLPAGRLGGITFGLLHLVLLATRVDPLRPDNPDFDIVGPPWLALLTFGAATIVHGVAVVGFTNRYSHAFPAGRSDRASQARSLIPLSLPVLFLVPGAFLLVPLVGGVIAGVLLLRLDLAHRIARSRAFLLVPRLVLVVTALWFLPGAVADLRDVLIR